MTQQPYHPEMTDAGLSPTVPVTAIDEQGLARGSHIAGERPLTLYVDKREILTLMTLGTRPELLVLGWLRNQGFVTDLREICAVQVDWETDSAAVTTRDGIGGWEEKLSRRTVTTGCGQGTVFGRMMDEVERIRVPQVTVSQSLIYALLDGLNAHNEIYRQAGAVHGCALCADSRVELFVEDVGRHNAVDAIAGHMWLNGIPGRDKLFYTTGRLTSEMAVKVARMGIPVLISRSGITEKGLELARTVGVTMIARAKGRHFLVYHGAERIRFDAKPEPGPGSSRERRSSHLVRT